MFTTNLQKGLALLLVAAWPMNGIMAAAASGQALGKVMLATGASVEGVALPTEGTILSGDLLSVGKGGRALVKFEPAARAALAEETSVRFRSDAGRLVAALLAGTVVAERQGKEPLRVETEEYLVEPTSEGRALYMVTVLADKTTVVAARYGNVAITSAGSGERQVLSEGNYAVIPPGSIELPGQGKKLEAGQAAHGKINKPWHIGRLTHEASEALVAAIVVGAALAIALPLTLGEEAPVSPAAP
jgi:hypothetical protein